MVTPQDNHNHHAPDRPVPWIRHNNTTEARRTRRNRSDSLVFPSRYPSGTRTILDLTCTRRFTPAAAAGASAAATARQTDQQTDRRNPIHPSHYLTLGTHDQPAADHPRTRLAGGEPPGLFTDATDLMQRLATETGVVSARYEARMALTVPDPENTSGLPTWAPSSDIAVIIPVTSPTPWIPPASRSRIVSVHSGGE